MEKKKLNRDVSTTSILQNDYKVLNFRKPNKVAKFHCQKCGCIFTANVNEGYCPNCYAEKGAYSLADKVETESLSIKLIGGIFHSTITVVLFVLAMWLIVWL